MVVVLLALATTGCQAARNSAEATERARPPASTAPVATPTGAPKADVGQGRWSQVEGAEDVPETLLPLPAAAGNVLLLPHPYGTNCVTDDAHRSGPMVYAAATGRLTATPPPGLRWLGYTPTVLPDGRVLVAGGYEQAAEAPATTARTSIWDAATGSWTETAAMRVPRENPYLVTMSDGRVLAIGGSTPDPEPGCELCSVTAMSAEIYDAVTNEWTGAAWPGLEGDLTNVIAFEDGPVLALVGSDEAALLDTATETWTRIAPAEIAAVYRWDTSMLPIDTWHEFQRRNAPPAPQPWRGPPSVGAAVALLRDGRIFMAGGETDGMQLLRSAVLFDPDSGGSQELAPMPAPRAGAIAAAVANGSVLVAGGWDKPEREDNDFPYCVAPESRLLRWDPGS